MVLFALTELVAEVAIWTLRKTLTYSWRGIWWGISRYRQISPPASKESDTDASNDDIELQVRKLQLQLDQQQKDLAELREGRNGGMSPSTPLVPSPHL
jgi:hypothetical protein